MTKINTTTIGNVYCDKIISGGGLITRIRLWIPIFGESEEESDTQTDEKFVYNNKAVIEGRLHDDKIEFRYDSWCFWMTLEDIKKLKDNIKSFIKNKKYTKSITKLDEAERMITIQLNNEYGEKIDVKKSSLPAILELLTAFSH